jgi:hypothetical protein
MKMYIILFILAYDEKIGMFQCPTPGYYVFFVAFLIYPQKRLEAEIVKNGNVIQRVYAGHIDCCKIRNKKIFVNC